MPEKLYGLMAEFDTAEHLKEAAEKAHAAGYRRMDAYSPFPIEGLAQALGYPRSGMPTVVFVGGLIGALSGYALQYYISVIDYPLNIGGRPLNSWPAFIPAIFEMTVLFAALSAVLGMILMNGLPQPYHPVFNVPRFALASNDRFFLCIEARDPKFNLEESRTFLQSLQPREVAEVLP